ncbi:hypothetical protein [Flavobacterium adhaerens]|uniref:hypothetical protein n=1 Tax=Flavobacterium adhaerens TaxID=3149043 RepID=UPI0032B49FBB
MEEIRIVSEVINELIECGYVVNLDLLENMLTLTNNKSNYNIDFNEFKIDSIHYCHEDSSPDDIVYVFAISSSKLKLKAICISLTQIQEHSYTVLDYFKKVCFAFKNLFFA